MKINKFKAEDAIVRVKPSLRGDRSYLGEKLILKGVHNGNIYLQRTNELEISIFGNKPMSLPIDTWTSGWELHKEPKHLIDESLDKLKLMLIEAIIADDVLAKKQLKKAIKNLKQRDE